MNKVHFLATTKSMHMKVSVWITKSNHLFNKLSECVGFRSINTQSLLRKCVLATTFIFWISKTEFLVIIHSNRCSIIIIYLTKIMWFFFVIVFLCVGLTLHSFVNSKHFISFFFSLLLGIFVCSSLALYSRILDILILQIEKCYALVYVCTYIFHWVQTLVFWILFHSLCSHSVNDDDDDGCRFLLSKR